MLPLYFSYCLTFRMLGLYRAEHRRSTVLLYESELFHSQTLYEVVDVVIQGFKKLSSVIRGKFNTQEQNVRGITE